MYVRCRARAHAYPASAVRPCAPPPNPWTPGRAQIFKDGRRKTLERALARDKIHVVSPLWVEACKADSPVPDAAPFAIDAQALMETMPLVNAGPAARGAQCLRPLPSPLPAPPAHARSRRPRSSPAAHKLGSLRRLERVLRPQAAGHLGRQALCSPFGRQALAALLGRQAVGHRLARGRANGGDRRAHAKQGRPRHG